MREFHARRDQRRLQLHADMMLTRLDRGGEVGIAVVRTHPCSVHGELHGWIAYCHVCTGIRNKVNPRLPRVGLRHGVRGLVELYLKTDIVTTAGRRECRQVLGKCGGCKKSMTRAIFMAFLPIVPPRLLVCMGARQDFTPLDSRGFFVGETKNPPRGRVHTLKKRRGAL